jgi:hypothetical protein
LLGFLPWAVLGVALSRSCHLNRIAVAVPALGGVRRGLQRLSRWLSRESFDANGLLARLAGRMAANQCGGRITLCVDRTQWKHANLLFAAVSFRGRAIPVAILVLDGPKAANSRELRKLLALVAQGLPADAEVVVAGDREFGNVPAMRVIQRFGWQVRDRYPAMGRAARWSGVRVTGKEFGPVQLAIPWADRADQPWVLVSDLPAEELARIYRRRMSIDQMFSDLKKRGFQLESTRVRDPGRLLRLLGLLSIAYLWLLLIGVRIIKRGLRPLVDASSAKRTLSHLQIGLRSLLALIQNLAPPPATAVPQGVGQK